METLYTGAQCRELDRIAIEEQGVPGFELMLRAGRAAFEALLRGWPQARALSVLCGKGNNAGDGYVVAGLAQELGLDVQLVQLGTADALSGDAATARDWALARGVVPQEVDGTLPALTGDVLVDALLGTGLSGPLREAFEVAVQAINAAARPVLAIDIPTGVIAATGAVPGSCVRASVTVTFIGRKIGLHTGAGAAAAGRVVFADLGVGDDVRGRVAGVPFTTFADACARYPLPQRGPDAYKQALGHVLVVGGDRSMGGAPLMAAEAALRVGAGMVTVITRPEHRNAVLARRPEVMVADAEDAALRASLYGKASVLVVGPGLGREPWGRALLREAVESALPMVLDADGLHGLAELALEAEGPMVVTPHTAEAAALLGCTIREVQDDRPAAAAALAERIRGVGVLKGAGTVVASAARETPALDVCRHGNPGMATAGMGDVLAGMVGGLLAQGLPPEGAALVGVTLHSLAGDEAARRVGQRSLLATDLLADVIELLRVTDAAE